MIKSLLKKTIQETIGKTYPQSASADFNVEEPPGDIQADLSSNAAFSLARQLARSPQQIAESLAGQISPGEIVRKVEVGKNGFLNFYLNFDTMCGELIKICAEEKNYGKSAQDLNRRVLIEFVSANPTGPLHIGHARGASLGDSLARIYRQRGISVQTEYYVNDMGIQMQILAESVNARYEELKSKILRFPENGYQGEYIYDIARKMDELHREDFDQYPKTFLLDTIRKDLEDFGVAFDHWFFESSLHQEKKVEKVLQTLRSKSALKERDGALWFVRESEETEKNEPDQDRVLRKSDGRYTYFASDIAYHQDKFDRGFAHCIDIWGHDHHGYVPRVTAAMSAVGAPKDGLKILLYQLVSLKRGGKRVSMSTRSGTFITLKEILDEVGRDACRFFFAMRSPSSQLEFDVDLAKKQSNENPVYYVQYVHARICSIFAEAEKRGISIDAVSQLGLRERQIKGEGLTLNQPEEKNLIKKLCFFGDLLETSLQISSPHLLADYLMGVATAFHSFYDKHRILDAEPKVRESRMVLLRGVQNIVALGLSLLGVSAPKKM